MGKVRLAVLSALVVGAALLPATPGSAAVGDPRLSLVWGATDFAGGSGRYLIEAHCLGTAPGAAFVVMRCAVDGVPVDTSTPGYVGLASWEGSASLPYTVCGWGYAIYPDLHGMMMPPRCVTHADDEAGRDTQAIVFADVNIGDPNFDRMPGFTVPVENPHSVPELIELVCAPKPHWLVCPL